MTELEKKQFAFLKSFFEGVTEKKLFSDPEAPKQYVEELEDRFEGLLYNWNYEQKRPSRFQNKEHIVNLTKELTACDNELNLMCDIFGFERKKRDENGQNDQG